MQPPYPNPLVCRREAFLAVTLIAQTCPDMNNTFAPLSLRRPPAGTLQHTNRSSAQQPCTVSNTPFPVPPESS
jgi:hypothetical protein